MAPRPPGGSGHQADDDGTARPRTASGAPSPWPARKKCTIKMALVGLSFIAVYCRDSSFRVASQRHRELGNPEEKPNLRATPISDSLWHDTPLRPFDDPPGVINFVVEIRRGHRAKMELQTTVTGNPIRQDNGTDGAARFYSYGDPFFNYGFVPQTWEDPDLKDEVGNAGDGDPLDVMEVGSRELAVGSIVPARVLGALTLIDQGEMDNKIIVISLDDPDAADIFSMDDLEAVKPGMTARLVDWLMMYKTTDGKPVNTLLSDAPLSVDKAVDVIEMTQQAWSVLCHGGDDRGLGLWLEAEGCLGRQGTSGQAQS